MRASSVFYRRYTVANIFVRPKLSSGNSFWPLFLILSIKLWVAQDSISVFLILKYEEWTSKNLQLDIQLDLCWWVHGFRCKGANGLFFVKSMQEFFVLELWRP